jgi:hypothetical protein
VFAHVRSVVVWLLLLLTNVGMPFCETILKPIFPQVLMRSFALQWEWGYLGGFQSLWCKFESIKMKVGILLLLARRSHEWSSARL